MSVLRNVMIIPASDHTPRPGSFRVLSRTDIAPPEEIPRRSLPGRCPLCGSRRAEHPDLFTKEGDLLRCTICGCRINEVGNPVP